MENLARLLFVNRTASSPLAQLDVWRTVGTGWLRLRRASPQQSDQPWHRSATGRWRRNSFSTGEHQVLDAPMLIFPWPCRPVPRRIRRLPSPLFDAIEISFFLLTCARDSLDSILRHSMVAVLSQRRERSQRKLRTPSILFRLKQNTDCDMGIYWPVQDPRRIPWWRTFAKTVPAGKYRILWQPPPQDHYNEAFRKDPRHQSKYDRPQKSCKSS
jgi:hypothetical protein